MPEDKVQQWEYHRLILSTDESILDRLAVVGQRGWELVGIIADPKLSAHQWFYFKRPKV